ncbi:MAG: hypothetical protein RL095_260 [Verrucomicrobiota bacterium]|jgi:hypothetical protein
MKLYAQSGHGPKDKIKEAIKLGYLNGAIFSPKESDPTKINKLIEEHRKNGVDAEYFIDPQFYAALGSQGENAKLGNLPEWEYFKCYQKRQLEQIKNVDFILSEYYRCLSGLNLNGVISPNIYVSQSLDSQEAVIAKNFIRQARAIHGNSEFSALPLYTTLAINREALIDQGNFREFLNDITMLEEDSPDGFYVIIGSRSAQIRSDIYNSDVIGNWMLLNHALKINGFKVINGYSDLLTPFLGAAGAYAGATGWWENLRTFSMEKFFPEPSQGRQPVYRYLSKILLNRITFAEKEQMLSYGIGKIINKLETDKYYAPEPEERTFEVLQSWQSISSLCQDIIVEGDVHQSLKNCGLSIGFAESTYAMISNSRMALDRKSTKEHLKPLKDGIRHFREAAELPDDNL